MTKLDALSLEHSILDGWGDWRKKLEQIGLKQQRRATRVIPMEFDHDYNLGQKLLILTFKLPSGAYATNLVREILVLDSKE